MRFFGNFEETANNACADCKYRSISTHTAAHRSGLPSEEKMTKTTKNAIAKYSKEICVEAFKLHKQYGEGANTVGFYLKMTTRQADAAINAGREISKTI